MGLLAQSAALSGDGDETASGESDQPPSTPAVHTGRRGDNWIQTFTGKQFWPLDPRPEDIVIEDIAHALSMKCRYTGHCHAFYSVAQHSTLASIIVPPRDERWALLHDASEAYLPDVARPVKRQLVGFTEVEDRLLQMIGERFGLSWPPPPSIKRADLILLRTERRDLMGTPPIPWRTDELAPPLTFTIHPRRPADAKWRFLKRFAELFPAERSKAVSR